MTTQDLSSDGNETNWLTVSKLKSDLKKGKRKLIDSAWKDIKRTEVLFTTENLIGTDH